MFSTTLQHVLSILRHRGYEVSTTSNMRCPSTCSPGDHQIASRYPIHSSSPAVHQQLTHYNTPTLYYIMYRRITLVQRDTVQHITSHGVQDLREVRQQVDRQVYPIVAQMVSGSSHTNTHQHTTTPCKGGSPQYREIHYVIHLSITHRMYYTISWDTGSRSIHSSSHHLRD